MNLVLGTAALGFPYGVCNKVGKLSQRKVTDIIEKAWGCGIREFDTAQAYQDSEKFLGQAFKDLGIRNQVKVITKFTPQIDPTCIPEMVESLDNSLSLLGLDQLEGVLFHREYDLDILGDRVVEIFIALKSFLQVKKIGVSVYHPEYAIQALNIKEIDIVQFPGNVFDRRFERLGVFRLAEKKGKQIYLRNILLQGMLLADPNNLSPNMGFMRTEISKLISMATYCGLTRLELAINYLKTLFPEAKLILGAETPEQIQEIVAAFEKPCFVKMIWVRDIFNGVSDRVLIPKLWRLMA
uniref:Putative aldo-keto reductase family protein n=1 Tax=viral metagenome TaxID=1070528 RepID=A0A6M3JUW0_9ZZZZ